MPAASANSESEGEEDQQQQKPSFASASQHFAEYFFQAGIADDATLFLRRVLQPEEIQTPKKADPTIRASSLALIPEKVDSYVRPNPSGTESVAAEAEEDNELTGSEALLQQVMATIDKFDREREEASKDIARTWNDKHFRRTNIQLPSMRSASYTDLKLANDRNGRTNQQLGSTVTISEDTSSSDETGSEKRTAFPSNSIMSSRGFSSPALGRGNSQRSKSLSATQSLLEPAFTKHLTTELPSQTASKALEEIGEIDDKAVVPKIEEIVSASKPELASSTSIASLRNHPRSNPPPNPPPHRFFPKTSSIFHQSSPAHPPISLSTRRHPIEYKYYPEVISSFPCPDAAKLRNKDEKKDNRNGEGLPRYLSMFCFPNDISLVHECEDDETEMDPKIEAAPRNSKCDTRWHSFVITEDANTKFYGVCITVWERLSPSLQLQLDDWCKVWREDNVSDSDIEYVNHVRGQIQQEQSLIALARGRINASVLKSKTQTDAKQEPNVSSPTSVSTNTNKEPSAVAGDSATQNDANIETAVISTSDPKLPLPPNPSESSRDTSSVPGPIEKSLPPLPNEDIANEEKQAALQSIAESEEKILLYRELLKPFQNTMFVDSRRISVPRVIGIVSRWPWYEVLKEWITGLVLGTDAETPGGSIESHIVNLLFEVPVPPPGKLEVSLKCPGFPNRRLYCSRPALNEVPIIRNISFYPFFRALSHMNIIRIFETALTEGKIIFVSSHLSMLGLAAEVVSYLLFPLKFQGICVPVLPSGLLEYLEAPVPYIVGVGRDWWDGGKNGYNGIEDACIVDLDTNTLTYTGNPGHLTLPPKHRRKLFAQLNKTAPLHNLGVPYGVPENMKRAIPHGRNSVTESRLGNKIDPAPSLSRRSSLGDSISTNGTSVTGLDRRKSIRSLVKPDYDLPPSLNDPPKSSSQSRPEHPRGPRPFPVHQPTPVSNSSADRRSSLSMPTMQAWKKAVGAFSRKGGGGGGGRQELFPTDDTKNQKGSLPAFFGKNSREAPMFATSGTLDSVPVVASAKRRRSLDPSSVPLPSSQTSSSVNMDQSNDGKATVDPSCSDEQSGREKETETASLKTSTIASSSAGPLVSPNSGDGEVEVNEGLPALPPSVVSSVDDTGPSNANGSDLSIDDQKCTAPEVVLPDDPDPLPSRTSTTDALPHGDNSSSLSSIPLSTSYGHGSNKIVSSSNSLLSIGTLPTDLSGTTNVSATDMSRLSSGPDSLPELPTRSASMKSRRSSIASYFGSPYPTVDETVRRSEERTEGHAFLPRALEELGAGPYVTNECECVVCDQPVRSDALNCDACGTSIHRKCISRCIHPCSPTSFDEPKVLESFLRLFSSLLNNYRTFLNEDAGPDDDELFRKEAFLDTVDRDARPFLTHLVESQCFAQFVLERHERSSNDYEILFFDEMVKAKANRSRLKLAKEATPFLKDPAYGVSSTYDAMSPIDTAKSPESLNRWSSKNESARFPKVLLPESFPSPRPVQPLMTDEEARMLRIHTGAITRQARMAKDKLTRKQSKWVKLRTKSDLPERTALDHKLDRAYASLRNAERMMATVENKKDVQVALDALESDYRELKKIEKIDRSNQDDIEAIIKQMEDTSVRLKTSLSGTQ